MKRLVAASLTAVLAITACTTSTDGTTTSAPTSSTSTSTTTTDPSTTTTSSSTTTTSTTTGAPTTTTIPGDPFDFGPRAGDRLAVIGVEFDDVLNLRELPGTDQTILAGLAPDETEVVALGEGRSLPNSIWYKVEVDGTVGWVSSSFVAHLGGVDDVTSQVVDHYGAVPSSETMLELADLVAAVFRSTEEPVSDVTVTVAPTVGDVGEVTIDVVGFGDDAVRGVRLHIFGQPSDGGEGFGLMSVERTWLCSRGATGDGLCA